MMMPSRDALKILAFDTSTHRSSVAVLENNEVRAELRLSPSGTHSILLMRSVDFLLRGLGWRMPDLNLIAAGIGPGSFTGIRIGIATALGIAQSLSIPFAGISGLDAVAHQFAALRGNIGVLLDAHRSQLYYAEYTGNGSGMRPRQKPVLLAVSELERRLANRHLYIAGDVDLCGYKQSARSPELWPRILAADPFLASSIGRLASMRKRTWRSGDYVLAEPLYIRPPDALRNKRNKR